MIMIQFLVSTLARPFEDTDLSVAPQGLTPPKSNSYRLALTRIVRKNISHEI
jgi:hypothetical protein